MQKTTLTRRLGTATIAVGALILSGCAALSPSTPEQIVQKRAIEYWKARTTGQVSKAYALSTPSYRQLRTESQFTKQFGSYAATEGAQVEKVACTAEKCTVQIKMEFTPPMMGAKMKAISMYMDEIWLLEDGQWWHYQEL